MAVKLENFDYSLSKDLIADRPIERREEAKLMVVDRMGGTYQQTRVESFLDLFDEGDVLVLNNTKVFPARLFGQKDSGGKIEILLLKEEAEGWWAMSKPGMKKGKRVRFDDLTGEVVEIKDGLAKIRFDKTREDFKKTILEIGKTPLPPYINSRLTEKEAREKYQTVYAKYEGSVAAPTAGFHFSKKLLDRLREKGVKICYVTLHVGLGTFQGVKTENIEDHPMHSEWFELTEETAKKLNQYKQEGKRIISVGTTATRVLESCANDFGLLESSAGETNIFIYPPYKFKFVDALVTNFHLPKSTLLMLVLAFMSRPNGKEEFEKFETSLLGRVYLEAIKQWFRFFSFGDAMFIY